MKNSFDINVRVRYGETDQMGYVYYGNYALYLEQARTEMLRSLGFTYKDIEESGIFLPVVHMSIDYKQAAKYDELVMIKTMISEKPNRKIIFLSKMYNEQNQLLNECKVVLVFMNAQHKVIQCPAYLETSFSKYMMH